MLSTIAACGTLKKEIGLRRDSEAFFVACFHHSLTSISSINRLDPHGAFLVIPHPCMENISYICPRPFGDRYIAKVFFVASIGN